MAKLAGPETQRDGLTTHVVQGMRYYVLPLPLHMPRDCTVLQRMSDKYRQRVLTALHMVRHVPVEPNIATHIMPRAASGGGSLARAGRRGGGKHTHAAPQTVRIAARTVQLTAQAVSVASIPAM